MENYRLTGNSVYQDAHGGGGFIYERMVLMLLKTSYTKIWEGQNFHFFALIERVLEGEVILNSCPLGYLDDGIQYSPLARNMLIFVTNVALPEDRVDSDPEFQTVLPQKSLSAFKPAEAYYGKDESWNIYLHIVRDTIAPMVKLHQYTLTKGPGEMRPGGFLGQ